MEECFELGLAKAIGLSNFNSQQIQRVMDNCKVKPANNQVIFAILEYLCWHVQNLKMLSFETDFSCIPHQLESHLYLSNERLVRFSEERGLRCTAYCPLGSIAPVDRSETVFSDAVVKEMAARHDATVAQVRGDTVRRS